MDIHSSLIQTLYQPLKAQNPPHDLEDHTFASPEALAISAKPDIFCQFQQNMGDKILMNPVRNHVSFTQLCQQLPLLVVSLSFHDQLQCLSLSETLVNGDPDGIITTGNAQNLDTLTTVMDGHFLSECAKLLNGQSFFILDLNFKRAV